MFSGVNWETVLVASIPGLLILIGAIFNDFRKKRNARVDTDSAVSLKREPTWVELEESNRNLRAEMAQQKADYEAKINAVDEKITEYQEKTNKRIGALSNMLYSAADQWPSTHPGPLFPREDLESLEDTDVPFIWRNRVRPAVT